MDLHYIDVNFWQSLRDAMQLIDCQRGNAIQITAQNPGNHFLEIAVTDSGCGVSDAAAERLFDPFTTTKDSGLGMGLPISKAIISAHAGGQLTFRNNENGGATFVFTLPVASTGEQGG